MAFLNTGVRAFSKCELRTVTYTEASTVNGYATVYNATLECPNPAGDKLNTGFKEKSKVNALDLLKYLAGSTACRNCPMAGMSRVESLIYRAEVTEAEARLARATASKLVADAELRLAMQQGVAEIDTINGVLGAEAPILAIEPPTET